MVTVKTTTALKY